MVAAVGAFFLTRAVAANNRTMSVEDAAAWYARGQRALADGKIDDAVEAFRRATVRDRGDRTYVLALAGALTRNHDDDAARSLLLTLREGDPEDAEINLELARIAAGRHDLTEALRFYHNALYAPWTADRQDARRAVRVELIRFLLEHRQQTRAVGELMALTSDVPGGVDRADAHDQLGTLFAQAGDDAHALDQFQRALRDTPDDADALAGAGEAGFRLGRYPLARSYFNRAHTRGDTPEIVEHVLGDDPLGGRIPLAERRRRLSADVDYVNGRLAACGDESFDDDIRALSGQLQGRPPIGEDGIEAGVDLVARAAGRIVERCPNPTPFDRALVLIGREHGTK
jgi:Flp pilus assembly protein TadD